jgi:DNA-binding transcriptional LysR family regulator
VPRLAHYGCPVAPRPLHHDPDEAMFRVFLAVVETGSYARAGERLNLTGARVGQIIAHISRWYGGPVLHRDQSTRGRWRLTERGERLRGHARRIVDEYAEMRAAGPFPGPRLPRLACLPHHMLFVGRLESLLMEREPVGEEKIEVAPLAQQHRADSAFEEHAVEPLLRGNYALIIGPPPARDFVHLAELRSERLYTARLEAMVHHTYPDEEITLAELVRRRLLVPPRGLRSRTLLDRWIERADLPDPVRAGRIAGESYETLTSVLRVLAEHHRPPEQRRVVVVPSDVALTFKHGIDLGVWGADRYRWVPIVHEGRELTHDVHLTTGRARQGVVYTAVDLLREICAQLAPALGGAAPVVPEPVRRA